MDDFNSISHDGYESPLHRAAWGGDFDTVVELLSQGADINAIRRSTLNRYYTPLHCACWTGHLNIVKFLVEQGAHLNILNQVSFTPLNGAIYNEHFEIAKFLVEKGANMNTADVYGYTPLITACTRWCDDSAELIELMLQRGADVNHVTEQGHCALIAAAKNRNAHERLIPLLVENGADLKKFGKEALMLAIDYQSRSVVQFLTKKLESIGQTVVKSEDIKPKGNQDLGLLEIKVEPKEDSSQSDIQCEEGTKRERDEESLQYNRIKADDDAVKDVKS